MAWPRVLEIFTQHIPEDWVIPTWALYAIVVCAVTGVAGMAINQLLKAAATVVKIGDGRQPRTKRDSPPKKKTSPDIVPQHVALARQATLHPWKHNIWHQATKDVMCWDTTLDGQILGRDARRHKMWD